MATWLLTWTTYGTWLPGDRRGFVSGVREKSGKAVLHNEPGTEYSAQIPALHAFSKSIMRQEPVLLTKLQAEAVAAQFRETAAFRKWTLLALAVMANHVHIIVECGDTSASKLLTDFKAYATRRLNRDFAEAVNRIWWTERGSTRLLPHDAAVQAAVEYVKCQHTPLIVWTP